MPLDLNRREMPKQPPEVRSQNFSEVALGYPDGTAIDEAVRCLQCKKPLCVANCPVEIDIPAFVKCIAEVPIWGAYHYFRSEHSPANLEKVFPWKKQAELFLDCVRDKGFHFFALDFERALILGKPDNVKSQKFADDIGADAAASDAVEGIRIINGWR